MGIFTYVVKYGGKTTTRDSWLKEVEIPYYNVSFILKLPDEEPYSYEILLTRDSQQEIIEEIEDELEYNVPKIIHEYEKGRLHTSANHGKDLETFKRKFVQKINVILDEHYQHMIEKFGLKIVDKKAELTKLEGTLKSWESALKYHRCEPYPDDNYKEFFPELTFDEKLKEIKRVEKDIDEEEMRIRKKLEEIQLKREKLKNEKIYEETFK